MQQVTFAEFDANMMQLAEMIPMETIEGRIHHGLVHCNLSVALIEQEDFQQAPVSERSAILRNAYIECLTNSIQHTTELLASLSKGEEPKGYKLALEQLDESMENGYNPDDGPGLEN